MSGLRKARNAFAIALAASIAFAPALAEARANTGGSSGNRGSRTFSAPSATPTAPSAAQPMQRTQAQPGQTNAAPQRPQTAAPAATGGFFGSTFGKGLMGGLLGAGLIGLLMGNGFGGGLGSIMSFLGLILQVGLLFLVAMLAMKWFANRRQQQPAMAGAGANAARSGLGGGLPGAAPGPMASGLGGGAMGAAPTGPLQVQGEDYQAFERLLADVQTAYADENITRLRTLATDEMVGYFSDDIAEAVRSGKASRVSGVKLEQGDLSEAWRENGDDYATVAMRYSLVDTTVDRATGKPVPGSRNEPEEVTEIWTFVRPSGAGTREWKLSAIQQVG